MASIKPRRNPTLPDYVKWSVLENNTNATSHARTASLKSAVEEEWNKMYEEYIFLRRFVSKACRYNNWDKGGLID